MRMNIATDSLMERFLHYLLEHPERFARSEIPCCLQALWEQALSDYDDSLDGEQTVFCPAMLQTVVVAHH